MKINRTAKYFIIFDAKTDEMKSFSLFDNQREVDTDFEYSDVGCGQDVVTSLIPETSQDFIKKIYNREYVKLLEKAGVSHDL